MIKKVKKMFKNRTLKVGYQILFSKCHVACNFSLQYFCLKKNYILFGSQDFSYELWFKNKKKQFKSGINKCMKKGK